MSRKTLGTLDIKPQEVVVSDRALTAQASEPYFPCKTLEATEEQPKVARERNDENLHSLKRGAAGGEKWLTYEHNPGA